MVYSDLVYRQSKPNFVLMNSMIDFYLFFFFLLNRICFIFIGKYLQTIENKKKESEKACRMDNITSSHKFLKLR